MSTGVVSYPGGQHAKPGEKINIKVRYTGSPPPPDDWHLYKKDVGDSDYPQKPEGGWDINPPGKAADPGVELFWPVGQTPGSYDFLIEWTWKKPGGGDPRREKAVEGQFFVDKPKVKDLLGWCALIIAIATAIGGWAGLGGGFAGIGIGWGVGFAAGVVICLFLYWLLG